MAKYVSLRNWQEGETHNVSCRREMSFKCYEKPATAARQTSVFGQPAKQTSITEVNTVNFHPIYGTLSTANGNGLYAFWDQDNKKSLEKDYTKNGPITCTAFSTKGNIFAYASSDNWRSESSGRLSNSNVRISLHAVTEQDCRPRPA